MGLKLLVLTNELVSMYGMGKSLEGSRVDIEMKGSTGFETGPAHSVQWVV